MDVLQIIKTKHEELKSGILAFDKKLLEPPFEPNPSLSLYQTLAESALTYLAVLLDELYPDLKGVSQNLDQALTAAQAYARNADKAFRKSFSLLKDCSQEAPPTEFEKFLAAVGQGQDALKALVLWEDENLMIKIREKMRTEDREDLGYVIEEALEEYAVGILSRKLNEKVTKRRRA